MQCPFHDDEFISMHSYPETGTVYCFAGGCPTHGRSLDVIDIIREREGCTKHEAIMRAKALAAALPKASATVTSAKESNRELADEAARAAVLAKAWATMRAGVAMSSVAKGYLECNYSAIHALGLRKRTSSPQVLAIG